MRDFHLPGRSAVHSTCAMVATSHPLAAFEAAQVIRDGGSAADAAICATVLLSVCEPQMTGLCGDAFALISPAGSQGVEAWNASGRAPAGLSARALRQTGHEAMPTQAAAAVTVPGGPEGLCAMHAAHGRLELSRLLAPAIAHAEAGVPVAPRVASDWAQSADTLQGTARELYLKEGRALRTGEVFRAPGLAAALRLIARDGPSAFYEGEIAEDIVASLRAAGGSHTLDDLAACAHDRPEPVSAAYRGVELIEHPPNGQGGVAILILNILSRFDLAALDPFGAPRAHLEAEASKRAYAARDALLADPAHMADPDALLSDDLAERLAAEIDPARATPVAHVPAPGAPHRDTVYVTAVDRDGMAVSLIHSIFHSFGSGLATDRFGLLLHNRGAGFCLTPGHPNEAGPGKRPLHTIIPGMLREGGRVAMSFGVMGGQYQAAGHARLLTNIRDFDLSPQAAIDAPRAFAQFGALEVERGYPEAIRAELAAMGHDVRDPQAAIGGAQAIAIREDGVLEGGSDPRKDGHAVAC
ncbi:MAG: gamma-glutamyltransferase family protein [Paracoccaceae bacterium]